MQKWIDPLSSNSTKFERRQIKPKNFQLSTTLTFGVREVRTLNTLKISHRAHSSPKIEHFKKKLLGEKILWICSDFFLISPHLGRVFKETAEWFKETACRHLTEKLCKTWRNPFAALVWSSRSREQVEANACFAKFFSEVTASQRNTEKKQIN